MQLKIKIKRIVANLCLLLTSLNAYELELNLKDFAVLAAEQHDINILISDDINSSEFKFIIPNQKGKILLNAFKQMLDYKELALFKSKGFYYIDKKLKFIPDNETPTFYYLPLDNVVYNDIQNILKLYKIKSTYIKNSNAISYITTPKINNKFIETFKKVDQQLEQVQFKITVLETSINKMKERGSHLFAYMQNTQNVTGDSSEENTQNKQMNMNYFVNLITMPYNANTNVLSNSKSGFYAALNYLNQNDITIIKNSPTLTAKSLQKVVFQSVRNIPYLSKTATQTSDTSVTTNSYSYKDVGLKITIQPTILKDKIDFVLSLTIEDILNSKGLTPVTSKKFLSSGYTLRKGQLLVLSGINKQTKVKNNYGVPFLKDIFLLKELFSYKSDSKENSILSIVIEVI